MGKTSRNWDVILAACAALLIVLYSAFAVLTFWGALGGLAGGIGVWLCIWILRQRPGVPTLVLTAVALVTNAAAFVVALAIVVAVVVEEV